MGHSAVNGSSFPSFTHVLRARAQEGHDREALVFLGDGETPTDRWTYGDLDARARTVAVQLSRVCKPGDRALLLYPPGLEFVAAFAGCLYAGVIAVPAYPPRSAEHERSMPRLTGIFNDARPAVVLTASSRMLAIVRDTVDAIAGTVGTFPCIDTAALPAPLADGYREPARLAGDTVAFLQYTSGSTAAPKGVVLTHANLLHNSAVIRDAFGHTTSTTGLIWLPPYHDMGLIGGILQPLFNGYPVALMPPATFLQKPLRWLKAVSDWGAHTSGGPDFAYDLCVRSIKPADRATLDLSAWQVAFSGAEPVRKSTIDRFVEAFAPHGFRAEAFYPCYGLAESTLFVTGGTKLTGVTSVHVDADALRQNRVQPPAGAAAEAAGVAGVTELVGCGASWNGMEARIVDPQTRVACGAGEVGEIWLRGGSVAAGYWNKREQTTETFGARLEGDAHPAGPWLRTGDLGFFADGQLCIAGRCKDLIIIRGRNHHPHDLEHTAGAAHPALRPGGGAAIGVEVGGRERLVMFHEVERTQRDADPDEIVAAVREAVTRHHELQAHAVVLLKPGRLPRTSSGKVRRHACRDAFLSGADLGELARWEAPAIADGIADDDTIDSQPPSYVLENAVGSPRASADLETWLLGKLAAALGMPVSEIDPVEPFARYGLDSASAVALAGEIATELSLELEATLFWDYPTVRDLARHLAGTRASDDPTTHKAA